jgi:hypothetical protein
MPQKSGTAYETTLETRSQASQHLLCRNQQRLKIKRRRASGRRRTRRWKPEAERRDAYRTYTDKIPNQHKDGPRDVSRQGTGKTTPTQESKSNEHGPRNAIRQNTEKPTPSVVTAVVPTLIFRTSSVTISPSEAG